ncbi:hypothetical protein PMKS-003994 [Pichia membranifaciens]|uniref:Uncharacterized protein n=1 Tax=Pichia membranifaciens TaxID=4926 RepID=A0A1Q2YLQ7_9ASCO|nr:hypothetical protein PMKS-003994 [Pichia membranifaciens]
MYNKKLRGDFIDPAIDFRGSVANRSKLSICTLPPINTIVGEGPKTTNAKILTEQYIQARHIIDQRKPVLVTVPQKTHSISLPKKRENRKSKIGGGNLFSGWGKRISTFGNIVESFEAKEAKQRAVSLPQYHNTTNIEKSVHFPLQLESQHQTQPQIKQKTLLPPVSNYGKSANAEQATTYSYNNFTRQQPNYRASPIKHNYQHHRKQTSLGDRDFISQETSALVRKASDRVTENKTMEKDLIGGLKNEVEDNVVRLEEDRFTNFSNDSNSSLVSKLLESYSHMNVEQQSLHEAKMTIGRRTKSFQLDPADAQKSTKRVNMRGTSTRDSTSTNNDLFSFTDCSYTSGSSEFVSLPETGNEGVISYSSALLTTNYNKELPPVPLKKMDQSILRDYSGTEQDSKITDNFVPPEVPRHLILHRSKTQNKSPELFYDCDSFSFTSSRKSLERSDTKVPERIPEKKEQFLEDIAIFTRKSRQLKGKKKPVPNNKDETTSSQYLEKVGIEPFMLSGYQSGSPLKVINQ